MIILRTLGLAIGDSGPDQTYMTYWEASAYCQTLGEGWRLPTEGELRVVQSLGHLGVGEVNMSWYYWVGKTPQEMGDVNWAYCFKMTQEANPWGTESTKKFKCLPVKTISIDYGDKKGA